MTAGVLLFPARVDAQELAYVANFRSDTLSILRTDGDAVSATMPLVIDTSFTPVQQIPGSNPTGAVLGLEIGGPVAVALSRDGRLAYVVQTGSPGALIIVDTHGRRVVATIPLGTEPFALALSTDGTEAYVPNFGSDTVSVVDAATRQVAATITVGHGPSGVALSSDDRRAYITNITSNTVSVLDLRTRTVAAEFPAGPAPLGLARWRDSLLIANSGGDSVSIVRAPDNQIATTITVGKAPAMVVVNPSNAHAYVSNQGSDSVSAIDVATGQVTATIGVGREPFGLALTADGKLLHVANRSADTVSVIDTRTNTVVRTVPVGSAPFGVVVGPAPGSGGCHCAIQPGDQGSLWGSATFVVPLLLGVFRSLWKAGSSEASHDSCVRGCGCGDRQSA